MAARRFTFGDPALPGAFARPAVTVGVFDGVHRGHAYVLEQLAAWAAESDEPSPTVVVTFDPHPRAVLGGGAPDLLTTVTHRHLLLDAAGAEGVVVLPFTRELAAWEPEEYVRRVLVDGLGASRILVGTDHRFGHKARGDVGLLEALGREHGFGVRAVELQALDAAGTIRAGAAGSALAANAADGRAPAALPVAPPERARDLGGQRVSSTAVREALRTGRLDDAAALLGRPVAVLGQVVRGDQRGRLLGFPTANLDLHHVLRPPSGVYAARARRVDERREPDGGALLEPQPLLPAVVNIGRRPTFHPEADVDLVEVHLLAGAPSHADGLYGCLLEVQFLTKLRDERRFDGPDALRTQIQRDVEQARQALQEG